MSTRLFRIWGSCNGVFLTLTFKDSTFGKKNYNQRRSYIKRWCQRNLYEYICNLDFGGKKGREHYHVVGILKKKINPSDYKLGSINFKRLYNRSAKITEYIAKLTIHSEKDTVKDNLIYSRLLDKCPIPYSEQEILLLHKLK